MIEPVEGVDTFVFDGKTYFVVPKVDRCRHCVADDDFTLCAAFPCQGTEKSTEPNKTILVTDIAAHRVMLVTRKLTGEKP